MLKPSMQELMNKVGNRYLLVNLAAQRARDLSQESEETGEGLPDKAVKIALDEIVSGEIVYAPGVRVEKPAVKMRDLVGMMNFGVDDHEAETEETETTEEE